MKACQKIPYEAIVRTAGLQPGVCTEAGSDSAKKQVLRVGTNFELHSLVLGRITEKDLSEAEKSFPGIIEIYQGLKTKPLTFLQLVYLYEVAVVG